MTPPAPDPSADATPPVRARLTALATALRHFHSALLDTAKSDYEFSEGRIDGPFALYSLVMNHPRFQWLRPLSGLMATLDEVIDSKDALGAAQLRDVQGALDLLMGGSDARFADFQAGYQKVARLPSVRETEAKWRALAGGLDA
jgi:hypothetical protein